MTVAAARRRPLLVAGIGLSGVAAAAWLAGFAWFAHAAWTAPAEAAARADGIVVLTGGAARVETALRLLADGRAGILLVSGVGGPTEFADLARRAGIDPALGARVTIGRAAASTHGNALETAGWARANGLRSLLVVTAAYHMPRALTELGRALPNVTLLPAPVTPAPGPGLRLLAGEYTKYLATAAGLYHLAVGGAGAESPRRQMEGTSDLPAKPGIGG